MTDLDLQMERVVSRARAAFRAGKVRSYEQRVDMLQRLDRFLVEEEKAIFEALKEDLGKSYTEALIHEYAWCRSEIADHLANLKSWMEPTPVSRTLLFTLTNDYAAVKPDPFGVVTLLCPWNFPLQLTLLPLIGAISAGNCVVIKPSEVAMATERLFKDRLNKYLPEDCYPVVCGGIPETTALLRQRTDFIFFTGCTAVGRIVMKAAAEHLTPVILELGGKSPVYIDESSDMQVAANRIMATKGANAGQICVNHDYILCTPQVQDQFIAAARKTLKNFYGDDMQSSESYGRIINDRHFQRLTNMLKESTGRVAVDKGSDRDSRYMGIKILSDVPKTDSTMKEEIFGPILPIVTVKDENEAIEFINSREKPLVTAVYSNNKECIQKFIDTTSSGTVMGNDGIVHMLLPGLPFGGVGQSGMGSYHGKHSFDAFSHRKSLLVRNQYFEFLYQRLRYPPFNTPSSDMTRRVVFGVPGQGLLLWIQALIVAVVAVLRYMCTGAGKQ